MPEKLATELPGGISAYKVEILPAQLWCNECRTENSLDRAVRPQFPCADQVLGRDVTSKNNYVLKRNGLSHFNLQEMKEQNCTVGKRQQGCL